MSPQEAAKILASYCEEAICSGAIEDRVLAINLASAMSIATGIKYEAIEASAEWAKGMFGVKKVYLKLVA